MGKGLISMNSRWPPPETSMWGGTNRPTITPLHFVTVCTICYLLLSCGHRSLLRLLWVCVIDSHRGADLREILGVGYSPLPSSPSLPFLSHPLEVGDLNPGRGSGERCMLPQWGLGRRPSPNRIQYMLVLKSDIWWQQILWFSSDATDQIWGSSVICI